VTTEPDLTETQKAYNVAQYEMFQLAAYGHCTYTNGELLTAEGKRQQADYNDRIRRAREELEAAVLRLVAEHAETFANSRFVSADWLRSLADDPAILSLLAVRPDEREPVASVGSAPATDRAALSAKLWAIAEHHIVAEWICCEPLKPGHKLCAKGYAALGMVKTLLVDGDPEKTWNPSAPLLDAVLSVLPASSDRAAELSPVERTMLVYALDQAQEKIWSEDGFTDEDQAAVTSLRRRADETSRAETQDSEAHPAEHTWAAELHDPLADEWVPGTRYITRDRAVNALTHARAIGPTWKDGTPTERRLVRATTTYTVERAAVAQPETEIIHGCPPDGSGLTPCCGRTPFELPRKDRISSEAPVTCPAAAPAQPAEEA
jgi:hypothetical protein